MEGVDEIRRVSLGPEDRIAIRSSGPLTDSAVEAIVAQAKEAFGEDRPILVHDEALEMKIIGPEPPERAALEELLGLIEEAQT